MWDRKPLSQHPGLRVGGGWRASNAEVGWVAEGSDEVEVGMGGIFQESWFPEMPTVGIRARR